MLFNDIIEAINENEENEWETEAQCIYYNVKYDTKTERVSVGFVEEYHYDGDNWGEIEIKCNEHEIFFAEHITVEEYINMLLALINKHEEELEYDYGVGVVSTLKKICFNRV